VGQDLIILYCGYFFRSGQIETWARYRKNEKGCIADNLSAPEFTILPTMFSVCFHIRDNNKPPSGNAQDGSSIFGMNGNYKPAVDNKIKVNP
jgi:hypothetical protein